MQAERYIAAADLGSSKIALSVARVEGDDIQIIYYKETPSDGVRYSCVFNPMRASVPLKKAISEAEEELKIKILQVVVGLPRYGVRQEAQSARMERSDPDSCITKEEVTLLKNMAIDDYPLKEGSKEAIYGAVAQSFSADDEMICASESDVIGTTADNIEGNFKIFFGAQKSINNIDIMLNNTNVAPSHKLFLPNAVAQAVLTDEEKENGVALIEFGAGVTSLTIYRGKILRHYSAIPFGGKSITSDIRYECGFTDHLAENIKLAFGACMPDKLASLSEKIIQINDDETGSYEQLPVKYLSEIIDSREREIVDAMLYMIQESGYADKLRNGVVITGGAANMVNLTNLIRERSGYTVRVGYPRARSFSADGCAGINEMSAAASIGMILEAKKDPHLNCTEDVYVAPAPAEEKVREEEGPAAQSAAVPEEPELFNTEVITPNKKRRDRNEKKSKGLISWSGITRKLGNMAEKAFDNTVGDLFDDMGE